MWRMDVMKVLQCHAYVKFLRILTYFKQSI